MSEQTNLPSGLTASDNDVDKWTKAIFNSVGVITFINKEGGTHLGTGTLIIRPIRKTREGEYTKIFLVTNRHVLPTSDRSKDLVFKVSAPWVAGENKFIDITIPVYDDNNKLYPYIKINAKGEDVAVIDMTTFFIQNKLDPIGDNIVPYDMLATKELVKERNFTIGDPVYFIGYPSFFYNSKNATPLMRGGIIATTPMEEYYFNDVLRHHFNMEKLNGFLIDANSFGGSSGSLVILKSQYSQIYKGNIVHSSQKAAPFVLGILTHSYPSVNTGDNSQRLALGGVISSEVIIETINQFPI